ncbi:MAG: type II toxin-antitoxin system Phd/YefM family antitoxin [Myxococcota bacterium]
MAILKIAMAKTKVQVGEFRNKVSQYVRRAEHGETIAILRRDREVAVLAPKRGARRARGLVGCLRGSARVPGDISGPIIPEQEWFSGE